MQLHLNPNRCGYSIHESRWPLSRVNRMQSKETIYKYLQETFVDLFEIEMDAIHPAARLYEDLDIDSIDAIDMMVKLKEFTGEKIPPETFKSVRTVQDIVDAVYALISNESTP